MATIPEVTFSFDRFKKRTADDEHGYEQDDVGIDEACECGLNIEDACDAEAYADDHGREPERDLFCDEHYNGKSQKNQCNCGWIHFLFPPTAGSLLAS